MLVGGVHAEDRLIVDPGAYADKAVAVSLEIREAGPDQLQFTVSCNPKLPTDRISRAITQRETHGVAAPLKVKIGRWAFCFEAPNMLWFYDGMQRISLWTVTSERGLSRIDGTIETTANPPLVLPEWIRK